MSGHITQLPDEILKNIFERVAPKDIEQIKKLNKRFNAIGNRFKLGQVELNNVKFFNRTKRINNDQPKSHIRCEAKFPEDTCDDKTWSFEVPIEDKETKQALLDAVHKCFHKISAVKQLEVDSNCIIDTEFIEVLERSGLDLSQIHTFVFKKTEIQLTRDQLQNFLKKMPLKTLNIENIKTPHDLLSDELVPLATEKFSFIPVNPMECPNLTEKFVTEMKKRTEPLKGFSIQNCKPGYELQTVVDMATHVRTKNMNVTYNMGMIYYGEENDQVLLEINRQRMPLSITDDGVNGRKYEFSQSNGNHNLGGSNTSKFTYVMMPPKVAKDVEMKEA